MKMTLLVTFLVTSSLVFAAVTATDDVTAEQKALAAALYRRIQAEEMDQQMALQDAVLLKRYAQGKASLDATVIGTEIYSLVMNMVRIHLVNGSGIGMNIKGEWMKGWMNNTEWMNATESERIQELWMLYKLRHHKRYTSRLEESMRRKNFEQKVSKIVMHNIEYRLDRQLFYMGLNHLSDWSDDEVSVLRGYVPSAQLIADLEAQEEDVKEGERARVRIPDMPYYTNTVPAAKLPPYVNWTNTSWVGPIQDQYQCGSCWAFSSSGALEAQYYNKTKNFITLSEQNLIDCTYYLGNLGCQGGNVELAFDYVMTVGIDTFASYPYTGRANNGTCLYNPANSVTQDSGWMLIPEGDEAALQQAVAQVGPVSAAIDASLQSFQTYGGGVYGPANCSTTALDHAILVVGYGTTSEGQDYWLIKNSWGLDWGINGYMMMERNVNMCGIATAALFPLID